MKKFNMLDLDELPEVQSFLVPEKLSRSTLEMHCELLKDVYIRLGVLAASECQASDGLEIVQDTMHAFADLYGDLLRMRKEMKEYLENE